MTSSPPPPLHLIHVPYLERWERQPGDRTPWLVFPQQGLNVSGHTVNIDEPIAIEWTRDELAYIAVSLAGNLPPEDDPTYERCWQMIAKAQNASGLPVPFGVHKDSPSETTDADQH